MLGIRIHAWCIHVYIYMHRLTHTQKYIHKHTIAYMYVGYLVSFI